MKLPALCNKMDELVFVKSSYQRDLCLASIKRIKPLNRKVGQRYATKIYSHCTLHLRNLSITTAKFKNIKSV